MTPVISVSAEDCLWTAATAMNALMTSVRRTKGAPTQEKEIPAALTESFRGFIVFLILM